MDNLEESSREELISLIRSLKAHNLQLQNIISKNDNKPTDLSTKSQKSFDFNNCKYRHVLLKFFYLGWDYHGYVVQEDTTNTVEYQIFKALTKTCLIQDRSTSNYHRCGRTDKGVSSFSQVISLDIRSKSDDIEDELDYCKILNSVLPENIQFVAWAPVDENLSARFDCKSRTYKYYFPKGQLDIEAMKTAAKFLEGTHDFRNFCKMDVNNGVVEFIRTILSVDIVSFDTNDEDYYTIYVLIIKGNAFLWHQIRCIVGVLLLIGQHKENAEVVLELLDVKNNPRKPDYQMACEIPLNLFECHYENINWIYEKQALHSAIKKLHNFWTFFSVKTAMVKDMISNLNKHLPGDNKALDTSELLIPGVRRKIHVPLMKRQLCGSLEDKMKNAAKRQKRKEESKSPL